MDYDYFQPLSDVEMGPSDQGTKSRVAFDEQPKSTTQPLEARSVPPQLANTLEHIVGQLDILTQVFLYCVISQVEIDKGFNFLWGSIRLKNAFNFLFSSIEIKKGFNFLLGDGNE